MKRILIIAAIACAVALVVLLGFRNIIARSVAQSTLERGLGVKAHIGFIRAGLVSPTIDCGDIILWSPEGFGDKPMLRVDSVEIEYSPAALLTGRLEARSLRMDIAELVVVKNPEGVLNVEALRSRFMDSRAGAKTARSKEDWRFHIDQGTLSLRKITFLEIKPDGTVKTTPVGLKIKSVAFRNIDWSDIAHSLDYVLQAMGQTRGSL